ncbi:MAG: hypothetical protein P8X80_01605 [Desulfobacterales bacterium]
MKNSTQIIRKLIPITLLLIFSISGFALAAEDNVIEIEAAGSCQIADGHPVELAKSIAFYAAKRKAVDLAGRYLSRRSLIEVYELDKDEIYSLVARNITAEIVAEKRQTIKKSSIYKVRINASVRASDFVKAELEERKLLESETHESYHEEMEQVLSAQIDPGKDISKTYRLLRGRKWRIALIFGE